jgi:hypothetical protein
MTRATIVMAIGLLIAASIYALALTPYIGDGYDDGHYIALAQALAHGKGFSQPQMPGNPPEAQYPPGWPLVLVPVLWIVPDFPANAVGFKIVALVGALVFVALTFGWLRWRGESPSIALAVAMLTLFNPLVLSYATSAFSEMAYGACSILALWLVEKYTRNENPTWIATLFTSFVVAFAFYVRTFGITLVAATIVYAILRTRRAGVRLSGWIVAWIAPWFVRGAWLPGDSPYLQQFLLKAQEQPELGTIGIFDLIVRVVLNLRAYVLAGLPGVVMPSQVPLTFVNLAEGLRVGAPFVGSDIVLAMLVGSAVLAPILLRRELMDWYLAFYLGLGLLWNWEPIRFLVPLIPLLYGNVLKQMTMFGHALDARWRSRASSIGVALITLWVIANVVVQARYAWLTHQTTTPSPEWSARLRLFAWIEQNTRRDSVLASLNDYQVYLYTQRPVIRTIGSFDALTRYQVEYVVLVPYGGVMVEGDLSRHYFEPVRRAHPQLFESVYTDDKSGIQVWKVKR